MIKDTRKFEDKYYNNRLVFINDVFERNITDNESIEVYADTGWKTSHDIRIYYESVKNKKHVSESYYLSPKMNGLPALTFFHFGLAWAKIFCRIGPKASSMIVM
jgi:hypothetical protein